MKKKPRTYRSPVREAQALETRERILGAVAAWLRDDAHGEFTFDAIAELAGIERRTVFRHFETRDALLEAFWTWINVRVAPQTLPQTLDELVEGPRRTFPKFDEEDGVIRGSLHTREGRAMRMGAVEARRDAFRRALRDATRGAGVAERRRLEAVAHALYSAAAWESMRDYAGVDGKQAGDAASWALAILTHAVQQGIAESLAQQPVSTTRPKE